MVRDFYNAIATKEIPESIRRLVQEAESAGVYTTGIDSNKRGTRGVAINVAVYGYDESAGLAAVQVRECRFGGRHNRVRKDYYLIGRTEAGAVFAHPITSCAAGADKETPEETIQRVLRRLWGADPSSVIRQGDVAFVPVRSIPRDAAPVAGVVLAGAGGDRGHEIRGRTFKDSRGRVFTSGPARLVHRPGEHKPVSVPSGRYRVVVAPRASTWGFSAPTWD